jgi:hypothetical protein
MSLFVTPDESPFVFGAYVAHVNETRQPEPPVESEVTSADEDDVPVPVDPIAC